MAESDSKKPIESIASLLSVATAIAIIISVTFDVGYFSGIDINFFTLFSLAEHTLFALEAIPIALVFIFAVYLMYLSDTLSEGIERRFFANQSRRRVIGVLVYWVAVPVAVLSYMYIYVDIPLKITLILVTIFYISGRLFRYFIVLRNASVPLLATLFFALFPLLITFMLGKEIAASYISRDNKVVKHTVTMKDSSEIGARIIRSGEKGLLLYDVESKKIEFLKWDEIDQVEFTPQE